MPGQPSSPTVFPAEARADRQPCEIPTTCQPPSGWRRDPWPATICGIATTGLSLTLSRRFECGSGLAIELPGDGGANTVLAKVARVQAQPGVGWLLDCSFVSELSDEEVAQVLRLDPAHQPPNGEPGQSISGVLFQAKVRQGEYLRWFVRRLDSTSAWPLPNGKIVSMSVGGLKSDPIELRVKNCRLFGSFWVVDCKLKSVPSDEVLRALTAPPD
jgi:hypothetical protein